MAYGSTYTTVQQVLEQTGKATTATISTSSDDYALIYDLCKRVSAYIELRTGRYFIPYKGTNLYYFRDIAENGLFERNRFRATLHLDSDLLVTSEIQWDGSAVSATYYRERGALANSLPFQMIDFDMSGGGLAWTNDFADYISVNGVWGYHTNVNQLFTSSGQSATINSSATSLTVTDASAFDVLSYIRMENELMQVTARNTSTQVLTVLRGVNGYTASAHTSASVEFCTPMPEINLCATRIASYMYENRNGLGGIIQFADGTSVVQGIEDLIAGIMQFARSGRGVRI